MNHRLNQQRAVVIGAGIGGIAAAAALANHFGQVVVIERDELPADARPRPGATQSRHLHGLLSGGEAALSELFPGLGPQLQAAGAELSDPGADVVFEVIGMAQLPRRKLNIHTYLLSRPLLETVLREQLKTRANVQLRETSRVIEIIADENRRATGVRIETREGKHDIVDAALIVDASGRGVPTLTFLNTTGRPMPEETVIGTNLTYGSTLYSFPRGAEPDFKAAMVIGKAPEQSRSGYLAMRENGLWDVVMSGRHGDVPPIEEEAFLAFAESLPTQTIRDTLRQGRREAPILRYGIPENRRRHFLSVPDFPAGLLPIGDAVCNINPVFGQGMTVASKEAVMLDELLAGTNGDLNALAALGPAFLQGIEEIVNTPWGSAVTSDLAYPQTTGPRSPDLQQRREYSAGIFQLAVDDPDVHKLMTEVRHLLKPGSLLHTPELRQRIAALQQNTVASS